MDGSLGFRKRRLPAFSIGIKNTRQTSFEVDTGY